MTNSTFLANQIKELSAYAKVLNTPYWDDYKSAYVIGKFNGNMEDARDWLDGIAACRNIMEG